MRVLYLTHRLPYAPNRGDRIRAFHTLRSLKGRATVDLVSLVQDPEEAAHAQDLAGLVDSVQTAPVPRVRNLLAGAVSLTTARPLTHVLLDSPAMRQSLHRAVSRHRPDVVLAYCSGMARFALEPPLAGLPLVIDLVDVDSEKWQMLAGDARVPMRWIYRREALQLSRFEARAAAHAAATVVVNDKELTALAKIAPGARLAVVPSGVDREYWHSRTVEQPSSARGVVFCGVMNYAPNEDGAVWLVREIWPRVLARRPEARLTLVGAHPTERVKSLGGGSVEVTGSVPDVRPYLWRSAVAVAPLRNARGIQNKVLEAVASGLPTIVTGQVAEGLPAQVLPACRIATTPDAFADAIVEWLQLTPEQRRDAVVARADLASLAWEQRLAPLVDLLVSAALIPASAGRADLSP